MTHYLHNGRWYCGACDDDFATESAAERHPGICQGGAMDDMGAHD